MFLRSMDTSSSHLILGLPLRLVAYSFPYIFFGIAVSCILSVGRVGWKGKSLGTLLGKPAFSSHLEELMIDG